MSAEERALFEGRLEDLESQMKKFSVAMLGELVDLEKTGLMHTHLQMMRDIYGHDNRVGLSDRVSRLESEGERTRAWVKGALFVFSLLWSGVLISIELWRHR